MAQAKLTEGEYFCPGTGQIECVESCESRAIGKGCREKNTCNDYKEVKIRAI